jgi:hypothetical protein
MKHQKIKLVIWLDRLIVEVLKQISTISTLLEPFFSFLGIFFFLQELSVPMIFVILSSKATTTKNTWCSTPLQFIAGGTSLLPPLSGIKIKCIL